MLTIISPIEEELAPVREALAAAGGHPDSDPDAPAACHVIGMGRSRLEANLRGLLPSRKAQRAGAPRPDGLLLLGFAGGTDPSLAAGDLTMAPRYCRLVPQPEPLILWDMPLSLPMPGFRLEPRFRLERRRRYLNPIIPRRALLKHLEPDPAMLQRARAALFQSGLAAAETDSMTVEEFVSDAKTKGELRRQFQVGTVNMEDYWAARLAGAAQVPFLSVRAVVDTAGQGLPSYLLKLAGRPRRAGYAAITAHPWDIAAMLRLPRQLRLAQESLARFATAFVNCSTEKPSTNQHE